MEPIPDEAQKRFDQMGPQDDVSDVSSSDAESEEEEEGKEEKKTMSDAEKMMETKKMRSLNANDVENEDRDSSVDVAFEKCQNGERLWRKGGEEGDVYIDI